MSSYFTPVGPKSPAEINKANRDALQKVKDAVPYQGPGEAFKLRRMYEKAMAEGNEEQMEAIEKELARIGAVR